MHRRNSPRAKRAVVSATGASGKDTSGRFRCRLWSRVARAALGVLSPGATQAAGEVAVAAAHRRRRPSGVDQFTRYHLPLDALRMAWAERGRLLALCDPGRLSRRLGQRAQQRVDAGQLVGLALPAGASTSGDERGDQRQLVLAAAL